jgi:hypothetical protein
VTAFVVFAVTALLGTVAAWVTYELGRDNPRTPFDA